MTVCSRATVDTSVGLRDSNNVELQLQGAWQIQEKVRKFTKNHLKYDKKISILIYASYPTKT